MSDVVISPNMGLPVPVVGVELGPTWASDINACMGAIDSHNHTSGQGVPITPNAMNINADLPFNSNNATTLRSVRLANQSANLSLAADVGCVYEFSGDLWYNNAGGAQVRLTNGTNPAGGAGSIGGLPSGTASVNFSGGTYTFQSATSTPATMNVGPLVIGQPTNTSKNVTIAPNVAQASNYVLTLPLALPSQNSNVQSDSAGNLSFVANFNSRLLSTSSADYTMLTTDGYQSFIFACGGSNRTFTLAAAASSTNRLCFIERTDSVSSAGAGALTIAGNGAELIGSANTLPLYSAGDRAILVCNGTSWNILHLLQTEYLYNSSTSTTLNDTTSFAYGSGGALIQAITANLFRSIRALSAYTASDKITVEISEDQVIWCDASESFATNAGGSICPYQEQGSNRYGFGRIQKSSSTDLNIAFGQYRFANSGSYGDVGNSWSTTGSSTYWRVKKVRTVS